MARRARLCVPGRAHYVRQQAVHGQSMVLDDADRRALKEALAESARAQGVAIVAYALCDDALHLLVVPPQHESLGRMIQSVGRRHVVAFNRRHDRPGTLWAGRFQAAPIEEGEHLLLAMRRIDSLLDENQPWSSAPHRLGQQRDPLLIDPPELWALGNTPFERELGYRALLAQGLPPGQSDRLDGAVRGGWAFGTPAFVAAIEQATGRAAAPRPRGRPRRPEPGTGSAK
mgnify:CR=1 FL=1